MQKETRLVKARVEAYRRVSSDKVEVATGIADPRTKDALRMVVKPPKPSSIMKKSGAALILAPDPITAVPGVALLVASVAMKKRDPASLEDLVNEAREILDELGSEF